MLPMVNTGRFGVVVPLSLPSMSLKVHHHRRHQVEEDQMEVLEEAPPAEKVLINKVFVMMQMLVTINFDSYNRRVEKSNFLT